MKNNNRSLIITIITAAILVSGSMLYLGTQLASGSGSAIDVRAGIEAYIAEQEETQRKAQVEAEAAKNAESENVPVVSDQDHIYGNPDAEVTLIEYSDFECPFCKRFHPTAKELVDSSDGKVNWVYRHFPLGFHDPLASKQAMATECVAELAGNDAFWSYADLIYETTRSNNGMEESELYELASTLNVNNEAFTECMKSERYKDLVARQIKDGMKSGVTGTPGNILIHNESGKTIAVNGAQPLANFETAIDSLLNN